jgi:FkbM family methyltransferase
MGGTNTDFLEFERERIAYLAQNGIKLDSFFDVGASTGCWSYWCSKEFPNARFDMFEPLVDHVPFYKEQFAVHTKDRPNLHLHKVAVGAKCGNIEMVVYSDAVSSSALNSSYVPPGGKRVQSELVTLDHAVESLNLPIPRVIKMDTQGGEMQVLQGATKILPKVDLLLCECWLTRGYGPSTPLLIELAEYLQQFGFYLWDFGGHYRDDAGRLVSQDCFFLNARNRLSPLKPEFDPPVKKKKSWWSRILKS